MFKKTITDIQEMQANQIFAILDSIPAGVTVSMFRDTATGRIGVRVTDKDGTESVVSGVGSKDAFAQACQVML